MFHQIKKNIYVAKDVLKVVNFLIFIYFVSIKFIFRIKDLYLVANLIAINNYSD